MKVSIIKRLEALEKNIGNTKAPETMVISFEADTNSYRCLEQYEGTPDHPGRNNTYFKGQLEEIVISSDFHGVVLVDLMGKGEDEGGLYAFNADQVRRKAKLERNSSFSLKIHEKNQEDELKQGFYIVEI